MRRHIRLKLCLVLAAGLAASVGGTALANPLDPDRMVRVDPAPGAAAIAPTAPSWCDGIAAGSTRTGAVERALSMLERYSWPSVTERVGAGLCSRPDDPSFKQQTAWLVQAWVNILDLSPAEATTSIRLRVQGDAWSREHSALCGALPPAGDEATPVAKMENKTLRAMFGCPSSAPGWHEGSSLWIDDFDWLMDARVAPPSELSRVMYLLDCLNQGRDLQDDDLFKLGRGAVCAMEAATVDRAAVVEEAAPLGAFAAHIALEHAGRLEVVRRDFARRIDALASRDAAFGEVLVAAPRAGWDAWVATYEAERAAMELALGYEERFFGPSRSARAGCSAELREALVAHLGRRGAATREAIEEAAQGLVGATLMSRLRACYGAEGDDVSKEGLRNLIAGGRAHRGPRYAAWYAALDALAEVRADRDRFPLELAMLGHRSAGPFYELNRGHDADAQGVVASVREVSEDGRTYVVVTFKKESWKEPEYRCTNTGRITSITSAGVVNYAHACTRTGKTLTRSSQEAPVAFAADGASGVAKGRLVAFSRDYTTRLADGTTRGFPARVFDGKQQKRLLAAYGLSL